MEAVRKVLGSGPFELELLVDTTTSEYWAIDLNPRGFGQITLDIALGYDLPRLWYQSVTGAALDAATAPTTPPRTIGTRPSRRTSGLAVRLARGPHRRDIFRHSLLRAGRRGSRRSWEWRDPLPGLFFAYAIFVIRERSCDRSSATSSSVPTGRQRRRGRRSMAG